MKAVVKNVDSYLASLEPNVAAALQKLRNVIKKTAPKAEEVISYNMPAFKYHGMLVYYAAFKHHCSLFGANTSTNKIIANLLKNFEKSPSLLLK